MPKRLTPAGQAAPPVEPIITGATMPARPAPKAKATPTPKPSAVDNGTRYIRNLHYVKTRVTLQSGREIQLEPRGQREDLDVVNAEEQQDPRFLSNRDLIFEVITAKQAEHIIANQQTNAKQQTNPVWDHLRNAEGKPYDQRAARIEEVFEKQGVTVGTVRESGEGRFTDRNSEVTRLSSAGPNFADAPGSPGHPATDYMQSVPPEILADEYHEFLQWKQFKEQMEAQALRDSLNVKVEEVQHAVDAEQAEEK